MLIELELRTRVSEALRLLRCLWKELRFLQRRVATSLDDAARNTQKQSSTKRPHKPVRQTQASQSTELKQFDAAYDALMKRGVFPSAKAINIEMGRSDGKGTQKGAAINGRLSNHRIKRLIADGYHKDKRDRWVKKDR